MNKKSTSDAESLGNLVISTAEKLSIGKSSAAIAQVAANLLLNIAYEMNATEVTIGQEGCTYKGEEKGDWVVTVRRLRAPGA